MKWARFLFHTCTCKHLVESLGLSTWNAPWLGETILALFSFNTEMKPQLNEILQFLLKQELSNSWPAILPNVSHADIDSNNLVSTKWPST